MSENNQGVKPKKQVTVTVEGGQKKTFEVNVHKCKECRTEIWWRVEGKKKDNSDKWVAHTFEAGYPDHNHFKNNFKKKSYPILKIEDFVQGTTDLTTNITLKEEYIKEHPTMKYQGNQYLYDPNGNLNVLLIFKEYEKNASN